MRLYKFYSKKWALEALKKGRLKIATLNDLNDPFEFISDTSSIPEQRRVWHTTMLKLFKSKGLISFSANWSNPVLWSHYGERHLGAALGFDVNDNYLKKVEYRNSRRKLPNLVGLSEEERLVYLEKAVHTKYSHWSYEAESRVFVQLDKNEEEAGLYFKEFDDDLQLVEVIIGARSDLTSAGIADAVEKKAKPEVTKARLAFNSYKVVPQRNMKLQK